MTPEEQVRIVKEVGSDVKLFSDFLSKLAGFLYKTGDIDEFKSSFAAQFNDIEIKGVFSYKALQVKKE